MKEIIKQLVEAYGPSGYEGQVTDIITELVKDYVDELTTDVLGNLIAVKKGTSGKKVMFSAHTDEIGFVITHIDDKGFLRFSNVGGLNILTLVGGRVRFANGTIGVIGKEKGDLKELDLDKLFIDIGAKNREDALEKVKVGDFAIAHREYNDLGNRIVSKAMDDRIGCVVLIEALKKISKPVHDLYFVFSSQEEVGLRGARTSSYAIDPDLGIAVDVTPTGDTPEAPRSEVALGNGAAIKVMDTSVIAHPKVKALLTRLAEAKGIKYQYEVLTRGGTDAGAIHLTKEGVPSGCISIPVRHVHTPSEMIDLDDVQACVDLVVAVAEDALADF